MLLLAKSLRALDLKSGGSRFSPVFVLGYHGFNSCAALCMQPPGLPPASWDFKTQSSIRLVRIGPDFMLIYEFFIYRHNGYQSKNLSVGYLIHEFSFVQCHIRRFSSLFSFCNSTPPILHHFSSGCFDDRSKWVLLTEVSKKYNKFGLQGLTVNYY